MGVTWDRAGVRLDRMEETIALIRAHFADGEIDQQGTHVHAVGFEGVPKPVRSRSASDHDRRRRRARARHRRPRGRHRQPQLRQRSGAIGAAGVGISTAELTNKKIEWIRAGAGDRFDDLELEIGAYFTVVTDDRVRRSRRWRRCSRSTPNEFAVHPHALIGSVDEICDQLVERRETLRHLVRDVRRGAHGRSRRADRRSTRRNLNGQGSR